MASGPERRGHPPGSRRAAELRYSSTRDARPVEIGAVLEDDIDERDAEEREAAHDLRFRHRQHRRGQRIGDLVLDHLRRLAGIFGIDDDLRIGEIGNGIERHARDRVDAGDVDEDASERTERCCAPTSG